MTVRWGVCISDSFNVTNGVRQGGILSAQLFNIYIDGLSDILNKSSVDGSIGGKRINHMLYADDLCIVSLSSAGLQQLLTICDQYCAMHSITCNVKKYVCMFFRCSMNKTCDITNVVLSGNTSLSARILHRAPPPPRLQVDQNFLTQKIVADPKMRCHQKSFGIWRVTEAIFGQKTCFFSKNIFWKKIIINHTIFLIFRYAFFRY